MATYEIKSFYSNSAQCQVWTVVEFDDGGQGLGGDCHWLKEEYAQRAKVAYEAGTAVHPFFLTAWLQTQELYPRD